MTEKLFKALYKHDNQIYHKFAHVMHSILFDTSMDISRYGQGHITYTETFKNDPCLQTPFSECSSLVLNIYLHGGKYLNNLTKLGFNGSTKLLL